MRRSVTSAGVLALLALTAVACGASHSSATTTSTSTTTSSTSTSTSTSTLPTTTTIVDGPKWPLTGLPIDPATNGGRDLRAALAIKMSNDGCAPPQVGINQADIIFDEIVEGNITRFIAVFHSQDAAEVGPIRSGRASDVQYLPMFNKPIMAWSGGNPSVTRIIRDAEVIDRGAETGGVGYFRQGSRCNADTMFNKTESLWASAPPTQKPPTPVFEYLNPGDQQVGGAAATDATDIKVTVGGVDVEYRYDALSRTYKRWQSGRTQVDDQNVQIAPTNVLVPSTVYTAASYYPDSPEAHGVGTGTLWVFSGGKATMGSWKRSSESDTWHLLDSAGKSILLSPGQTMIDLARRNSVTVIS